MLSNLMKISYLNTKSESFGANLLYITSSRDFNHRLREYAQGKGFTLDIDGLWKDGERIAGRNERGIFCALGLDFVPPAERDCFWNVKDRYRLRRMT